MRRSWWVRVVAGNSDGSGLGEGVEVVAAVWQWPSVVGYGVVLFTLLLQTFPGSPGRETDE
jgi:hypothetical protein